jgi:DNA-binding LacI/PurR family transcriptional regulator
VRAPGAPTAIAAISDALALGVLQALADLGRTPGRDTAATGSTTSPRPRERA